MSTKKNFNLSLDSENVAKLDDLAASLGLSRSGMVNYLIAVAVNSSSSVLDAATEAVKESTSTAVSSVGGDVSSSVD